MADFLAYSSMGALMFMGLLLIFIILLQRGRGGGLAGALGGAGGQSALGTKAGDVFTKVTIVIAAIWIGLACLSIYAVRAAVEGQTEVLPEENDTAETSGENAAGSTAGGDAENAVDPPAAPGGTNASETSAAETPAADRSPAPSEDGGAEPADDTSGGPALGFPEGADSGEGGEGRETSGEAPNQE